jgi:adenylate cyclase
MGTRCELDPAPLNRRSHVLRTLVFALLALVLVSCTQASEKASPKVVNGVLDLSGWIVDRDGPIEVSGDWLVDWENSTAPAHDVTGLGLFTVPGRVQDTPGRKGWDDGSGSLALRVHLHSDSEFPPMDAFVPVNMPTSLECTTDDAHRVAGLSRPRDDRRLPEDMTPYVTSIPSGKDVFCTLRLHVPVWRKHDRAGIWVAPTLTSAGGGNALLVGYTGRYALVSGGLFVLGAFFVAEWLLRRREQGALGIAGAALSTGVWLVFFSHVVDAPFPMASTLHSRIEFASLSCAGASIVFAVASLLDNVTRAHRMAIGASIAVAIATLLVPADTLVRALAANQIALIVDFALASSSLFHHLRQERRGPDTSLIAAGLVLPMLLAIADVVLARRSIHVGMTTFGALVFAFTFAVVTARRTARAHRAAETFADAMRRFVPTEFLHALGHQDVTTTKLGDVRAAEMTVLFADIRHFTTISERLSPEATFALLNQCLSTIAPVIRAHGGFVDKYIGDAVMALFPRHPSDAVKAAAAMQVELARERSVHIGSERLTIGVGVHHGRVMLGTIGEAERFEATVISDTVNLTSRLESLTKQFGCSMLLTGDVAKSLDDELRQHVRPLGTFVVKGKAQAVEIHELFASDPDALRSAKISSRERVVEMLALHAADNVEASLHVARSLVSACPDDGPMQWWLTRLQNERANDALPSSRGIVMLNEK